MLENRELRQCLAEHQTVLEMVMGKFRRVSAHAARLERENSTMVGKSGLSELRVSLYACLSDFEKNDELGRESTTHRARWRDALTDEFRRFP